MTLPSYKLISKVNCLGNDSSIPISEVTASRKAVLVTQAPHHFLSEESGEGSADGSSLIEGSGQDEGSGAGEDEGSGLEESTTNELATKITSDYSFTSLHEDMSESAHLDTTVKWTNDLSTQHPKVLPQESGLENNSNTSGTYSKFDLPLDVYDDLDSKETSGDSIVDDVISKDGNGMPTRFTIDLFSENSFGGISRDGDKNKTSTKQPSVYHKEYSEPNDPKISEAVSHPKENSGSGSQPVELSPPFINANTRSAQTVMLLPPFTNADVRSAPTVTVATPLSNGESAQRSKVDPAIPSKEYPRSDYSGSAVQQPYSKEGPAVEAGSVEVKERQGASVEEKQYTLYDTANDFIFNDY